MKIIQIFPRVEGCGVTRYVIELKRSLIELGHEVDTVSFPSDKKIATSEKAFQNVDGIKMLQYNQDTYDYMNTADYVFIHTILDAKANEEYRNLFFEMIEDKITTKKAYFVNDLKVMGVIKFYGDWMSDSKFVNSLDYICTFSPNTPIFAKLKRLYGSNIINKYVHIENPYHYDENRSLWKPYSEKIRRISYLGRFAGYKDPMRLIRAKDYIYQAGFDCELRGILRSIGAVAVPDLFYKLDEDGNKLGDSEKCIEISKKWRTEHNIDLDDSLIDYKDRDDKIFVFGAYNRSDGMKVLSKSMFSANFYNQDNVEYYGDMLEYSILESIDAGTIPVLDTFTGNSVYYNENAVATIHPIVEKNMALFLDSELNTVNDFIDSIKTVSKDQTTYDEFRNKCWDEFKIHANPIAIATRLIHDLEHPNIENIEKENNKFSKSIALF